MTNRQDRRMVKVGAGSSSLAPARERDHVVGPQEPARFELASDLRDHVPTPGRGRSFERPRESILNRSPTLSPGPRCKGKCKRRVYFLHPRHAIRLASHRNYGVGRAGLEPATYGLKERSDSQHLQAVKGPRGRVVGIAARALLDAAERGVVFRDDAVALAREWLEATGGDLAIEVIEAGDEHAAARVIELAQHVLRVLATDESAGETDAHGGRS